MVNKIIPSNLEIIFPFIPTTNNKTEAKIITIKSDFNDFTVIGKEAIQEAIPKIIKALNKLLPTTFPIEIFALPFNAEAKLTAVSGADVPIATTVNPIINSDIPNLFAIFEADSTKKSAPLINNKNPIVN